MNYPINLRVCFVIIILFGLSLTICGQDDYYIKGDTSWIGVQLISGGEDLNSRFCQVKFGSRIITYTPDEVSEYGFKAGRTYISKSIKSGNIVHKVFLERMTSGKASLYYYRGNGIKTFFIEKEGTLFVELPLHDTLKTLFKTNLATITEDCPNVVEATKHVSYNRGSLTKLISRYNNCVFRPFPHFRYGLTAGYNLSSFVPVSVNTIMSSVNFRYDGSITAGLFIDNPVFLSDFSIHFEVKYSRQFYSYNWSFEGKDTDYLAKLSTFEFPILFRYTFPSNNFRPYINAGGLVTWNFKNTNYLYVTEINHNIINLVVDKTPLISGSYTGYAIGGGIEYAINYKKSLFAEIRYNRQYSITGSGQIKFTVINLLTGISF